MAGALRAEDQSLTRDGLVRYIGETFRRTFGGRWQVHDGQPAIADIGPKVVPMVPIKLLTSVVDSRTGGNLAAMVDYVRAEARA